LRCFVITKTFDYSVCTWQQRIITKLKGSKQKKKHKKRMHSFDESCIVNCFWRLCIWNVCFIILRLDVKDELYVIAFKWELNAKGWFFVYYEYWFNMYCSFFFGHYVCESSDQQSNTKSTNEDNELLSVTFNIMWTK
jgi:hypothetical protein